MRLHHPKIMKNAFTLIELLVVITILAIVGVVSFANFGNLKQDQDLKSAASDLQSLARLAQSNAASRLKCGSDTVSGANWILEFKSDQKTISLSCQVLTSPPPIPTPTPIFERNLILLNNITIDSVNGCSDVPSSNPLTITYSPLHGNVTFDDASHVPPCVNNPTLPIVLKDSDGQTKTVIINKGGSVDVQ